MLKENQSHRKRTKLAASIGLALMAGIAGAAEINTGNPDIELRWDNTVRYNGGWRMEDVNPAFYNSPLYDETEGKFKKGDMVTNRLDLLSELDFTFKRKFGFRVSGAAWTDGAYGDSSTPNPVFASYGMNSNYSNNTYNSYAKRYVAGPSGEILDAFVFGNFDLSSAMLSVKAGQHNVYWGESLYSITNSIAYSQGPVDTIKAASSPGAEAKELFLPLKQLSAQLQLSNELSLAAQYAFAWKPFRLVPGGTYFAAADGARSDYAVNLPGPFDVPNGSDLGPEQERGNFGVNLRWSPTWLDGSAGLYYRKFDEMLPWAFMHMVPTGAPAPYPPFAPAAIRMAYARDVELYGLSLTKNLKSVSVGAEMSVRKNTALNGGSFYYVFSPTAPTYQDAEGARGDTLHALVNGIWLMPKTALWQGGTLQGELNYSHLLSVTKNPDRFYGEGYAACAGLDKSDGCSTKDAFGMSIAFTPEWPQALSGWDISMPTTVSYQIRGNGAALGGGSEGDLAWSIGVVGKLHSRYEFSLRYADTVASYKTDPATGVVAAVNWPNAVQNNHGWLSFTFKTSF